MGSRSCRIHLSGGRSYPAGLVFRGALPCHIRPSLLVTYGASVTPSAQATPDLPTRSRTPREADRQGSPAACLPVAGPPSLSTTDVFGYSIDAEPTRADRNRRGYRVAASTQRAGLGAAALAAARSIVRALSRQSRVRGLRPPAAHHRSLRPRAAALDRLS